MMQTQGIGKQDNWERFMQLSNAARIRNHGLSSGLKAGRSASLSRPAVRGGEHSGKPTVLPQMQLRKLNYDTVKPVAAKVRILGGKFDSYA
jgi:hypothetical protein